jgi:hypothetical protein
LTDPRYRAEGVVAAGMRRLLLALLAAGLLGTALDLVLLEHYEDAWQWPPLLLIALSLTIVAWVAWRPTPTAILALRVAMVVCIASAAVGLALHYNGNREFQHEIDPELAGWSLFLKVITAKAPPALAPAVMAQLGLIGLLHTYRHPAFD